MSGIASRLWRLNERARELTWPSYCTGAAARCVCACQKQRPLCAKLWGALGVFPFQTRLPEWSVHTWSCGFCSCGPVPGPSNPLHKSGLGPTAEAETPMCIHTSCVSHQQMLKAVTNGHPFLGKEGRPSFPSVTSTSSCTFIYCTNISTELLTSQAPFSVLCKYYLV